MKNEFSRKLLFTTIALAFLTILLSIIVNLFTGKKDVTDWLENISLGYLVSAVIIIGFASILLVYLQIKYTEKADEEKELLAENIEPNVKKFYDSLKERYQKRYESKLNERFEINLEVSEDWDGNKTQTFKERYDKDAKISEAFPRLKELFDTKDGLLIVGEPGAGKTVLLLKVALNLLENTKFADKEKFPVIFNLASWNEEYKDFGEWLKAMLVSGNGLSKDFAGRLLREKRLILLLDGLDELARNEDKMNADKKRAACLKSLNNYLDCEKTVICCRIDEFVEMQKNTAQTAPVSAKIKVLNLTEVEVIRALGHAQNHTDTKHHASAKNLSKLLAKDENTALRKILRSPFYFTIALEVFYKRLPAEINLPQDEKKLGIYLIEKYVERKLNKTLNPNKFDKGKTKKWLKWLAQLMNKEVTFELANLQPTDLIKKWCYRLFVGLVFGLVGGLVIGSFFGSIPDHPAQPLGLDDRLVMGSFAGLISGLPIGLLIGFFGSFNEIKTEDTIKLSFIVLTEVLGILVVFLSIGLYIGWETGYLSFFLPISLVMGLIIGLGGDFSKIEEMKKIIHILYLQNPYQRLFGGFSINLLICSFPIFIICPLLMLFNFTSPFIFMAIYFSVIGLMTTPIFLHSYLRLCFWFEGAMPVQYATFLNYAAEARILEKDGGQWRFRHQNLQEYFVNLEI